MKELLVLNKDKINKVVLEATANIQNLMEADLAEIILYGSCSRGDYTEDSDIDIALIMNCDRMACKKYDEKLADIATELAMKYFAIVNFVCIPYQEFTEKKVWYAYFKNIEKEGRGLYG